MHYLTHIIKLQSVAFPSFIYLLSKAAKGHKASQGVGEGGIPGSHSFKPERNGVHSWKQRVFLIKVAACRRFASC